MAFAPLVKKSAPPPQKDNKGSASLVEPMQEE